MRLSLLKQPSAFVPLVMSLAALIQVLAYVAAFGNADEGYHDEGAPARIFQLLLVAQSPIIAFFAVKWLPRVPKEALAILAMQAGAGLAPIFTVLFLER